MENKEIEKSTLLDTFLEFSLLEKCMFVIMCFAGSGMYVFAFMAMSPHVSWAILALLIDVFVLVLTYIVFKISIKQRTGEKTSISLNPTFHWGGKKY